MKSNNVPTTPKIRLTGNTGTIVDIDVSNLQATDDQKAAVRKFLGAGDLSVLSDIEKALIKDLKAYVGLGSVSPMLIVRFDATWIRIDE